MLKIPFTNSSTWFHIQSKHSGFSSTRRFSNLLPFVLIICTLGEKLHVGRIPSHTMYLFHIAIKTYVALGGTCRLEISNHTARDCCIYAALADVSLISSKLTSITHSYHFLLNTYKVYYFYYSYWASKPR